VKLIRVQPGEQGLLQVTQARRRFLFALNSPILFLVYRAD
jgi:hypothetical protein